MTVSKERIISKKSTPTGYTAPNEARRLPSPIVLSPQLLTTPSEA